MNCKIVSIDKNDNFNNVTAVTLPAVGGLVQILPGHAEAFMKIQAGEVILKGKQEHQLAIIEGICHIKDNQILIIQ